MRTFEYRLYPNRKQEAQLQACLHRSLLIYNEMLFQIKRIQRAYGQFLSKYELDDAFKGCGEESVPATTVQALADRVHKAIRRYSRCKAQGLPCGFPRVKTASRWHSIQLRQYGRDRDCWLDEQQQRLRVPGKLGTSLKIKLHRPLEGAPQTVYLVLRADGYWYALIVCEPTGEQKSICTQLAPKICAHPDIGLDMGLKAFVTDSDGNSVANPRFYYTSEKRLRRQQRRKRHRKPGSHRRRKAAQAIARTRLKIKRQRRDFFFKTARRYAERYRRICVEDLSIRRMMRDYPYLAKQIKDAGWGTFLTILEDKAERAGHQVIRVPAYFTSQICNGCGAQVKKALSVRTHVCPECGYVEDRDVNAAKNILWAGALPSGEAVQSDSQKPEKPAL